MRAVFVALGVDDAEVEEWLGAVRRARGSSDRRMAPSAGEPPYRGLASFGTDDARLFFGRQQATREILDRIAELARDPGPSAGVMVVVAPSGAGKSSVLQAGVVAAIRRGELDDPDTIWTCSVGTPNAPATTPPAAQGGHRVLVIDQFEELFTLLGPGPRAEVLRAVTHHAGDQVVVLGMRADFYAEAARVPALLAALQHAQVLIGPMNADELRDAIRLPAEHSGLEVDENLVELVLADLEPRAGRDRGAHDLGTLPLMSHALLAAWDRSDGRRLTVADYRATGGIDGAVQQTAEDAYAGLPPDQQRLARSVFLRLVHVDGDVVTTRRRIDADELDALGGADTARRDAARQLVSRFVDHRLVTAGNEWYEISHEALLSAWPRLRDWVDEDRAGLVTHRRLIDAARDWLRSGRDPGSVLHGTDLDLATAWADGHPGELNDVEREFLVASVAGREREQRAERFRLQRLRALLTASVVLIVLAVVLGLVLVQARDRAERSRALERAVRTAAQSRAVTFQASQLYADNPALSEQLALAAYRADPGAGARGELTDQSARPIVTRVLGQTGPTTLATSATRQLVAVSHAVDGSVRLYSLAHGPVPTAVGVLPGRTGIQVFGMAFSGTGSLLAVGGESGTVQLWDVADPRHPNLLTTVHPDFEGAVEAVALSPDGHTLVAGSVGTAPVQRWDVTTPSHPVALPKLRGLTAGRTVKTLAFDRTGGTLAAADSAGAVLLWRSPASRTPSVRTFEASHTGVPSLVFDPVRPLLVTGDGLGQIDVWSTSGNGTIVHPVHTLSGKTNSQVNVLALSPDGTLLAAGSSDSDLRQWDTADWSVRSDTGNPGPVTGVDFLPGGRVATTAADGALRLQSTAEQQLPTTGSTFALVWSSTGHRLLVGTNGNSSGVGGGEQLWDASDPDSPRRLGPLMTMPAPYDEVAGTGAMTADGDLVAGGNDQGRVELWDTSDPARPRPTTAPFAADGGLVESLAFVPYSPVLVVAGDDNDVHLWDVADPARPRELATMKEQSLVLQVAVSRDGRELAAGNADDATYLYRITDPSHPTLLDRITGTHNYVWGVGFSPNGRRLAAADADTTTRVYDITRPTHPRLIKRPLIGPSDYDYGAVFDPDGRALAVASNDGTVRTYAADGTDRVPLQTLRSAGGPVFVVAYNPSGGLLAAGGRQDSVTIWSTRVRPYERRLCQDAGTPITRAEWSLYVPGQRYDPPCR